VISKPSQKERELLLCDAVLERNKVNCGEIRKDKIKEEGQKRMDYIRKENETQEISKGNYERNVRQKRRRK
jgi:hypothetical protein